MTYYLIVGAARSGTTFIHKLVASHPEVSALSAELNIDSIFFKKGTNIFTHGNESPNEKKEGFKQILEAICELNRNENTKASGAKIAVHYPDQANRLTKLIAHYYSHFKIILIERRDYAAQYGSYLQAHITGVSHSDFKLKSEKVSKNIRISPYWFKKYLRTQLTIKEQFNSLKAICDCLSISYEDDILNGNSNTQERIFSFLGISEYKDVYRQKKINLPASNYIKNYKILKLVQEKYNNKYFPNKPMQKPLINSYLLFKILINRILRF